ncbi:hypothetical protein CPC08DRAFT_766083 [Agrocybe pediades]|nr:hypothetical protein CPC08DRAFT_766083 [Agrocybe pediades]
MSKGECSVNREKVNLANAKRRKAKRSVTKSSVESPKALDGPSNPRVAQGDAYILSLIDEAAAQYHDWLSSIDKTIRIFDACWDMASGWMENERFEGSFMEKLFQDRLDRSEALLDKLRYILDSLPSMGKAWTTEPQLLWLQERRGAFLAAQSKRNGVARFLLRVHQEWQKTFPEEEVCFPSTPRNELTIDELDILMQAKIERRKRLKWWFFWHSRSRKSTRGNSKMGTRLLEQFKKLIKAESTPVLRAPHPCEIYMKEIAKAKVDAAYDEISKEANPSNAGEKVSLRRSIAKDLLRRESKSVQQLVDARIQEWKAQRCKVVEGSADSRSATGEQAKEDSEPTPEEYQTAIDELPAFILASIEPYLKAAGLKGMLIVSGPMPVENGKIMTEVFHFGPESPTGLNFSQAHATFQKDVAEPFTKHARECYPKAVRQARSMINRGHLLPGGLEQQAEHDSSESRDSIDHGELPATLPTSLCPGVSLVASPAASAGVAPPIGAPASPDSSGPPTVTPSNTTPGGFSLAGGTSAPSAFMAFNPALTPPSLPSSLTSVSGWDDAISASPNVGAGHSWGAMTGCQATNSVQDARAGLEAPQHAAPIVGAGHDPWGATSGFNQATTDSNVVNAGQESHFEAWLAGRLSQETDMCAGRQQPEGDGFEFPAQNTTTGYLPLNDFPPGNFSPYTPLSAPNNNSVGHMDYTLPGATFTFNDKPLDNSQPASEARRDTTEGITASPGPQRTTTSPGPQRTIAETPSVINTIDNPALPSNDVQPTSQAVAERPSGSHKRKAHTQLPLADVQDHRGPLTAIHNETVAQRRTRREIKAPLRPDGTAPSPKKK